MIAAALLAASLLLGPFHTIDGDTFRDRAGETYRIANIDAPELSRPRCAAERALAALARDALARELSGGRRVEAIVEPRRDRYGRVLARIRIDGRDVGETLIAARLAEPWRGRRADWCACAPRAEDPA